MTLRLDSEILTMSQVEKTVTMTLKADPEVYRRARRICGELCISVQELLRRALAREIAYNDRRVQRKGK